MLAAIGLIVSSPPKRASIPTGKTHSGSVKYLKGRLHSGIEWILGVREIVGWNVVIADLYASCCWFRFDGNIIIWSSKSAGVT